MVAVECRWILGVWVPEVGTYAVCWIWTSENAPSRTLVNKGNKKGRGVLPQAPPARNCLLRNVREPAYLPSSAHCPNICPAVSTDVTGWASILQVS